MRVRTPGVLLKPSTLVAERNGGKAQVMESASSICTLIRHMLLPCSPVLPVTRSRLPFCDTRHELTCRDQKRCQLPADCWLVLAIGSDYCNADRRLPANLVGMSIILHSSACGPARMVMVAVDVSLYCIGECGGALCNTELAHTQCTSVPDKHRFMPLPFPPQPSPAAPKHTFLFRLPFRCDEAGNRLLNAITVFLLHHATRCCKRMQNNNKNNRLAQRSGDVFA